ncbi:unnamed protein product [Vitrella brassicaformis CCMP3155]|uniref:RAP domain-containing protein n=1 Tax=Vitrella brassicaformis (strain CCMP3155) TaxID=1169540 RepID=A0A0G4EY59_VITBC|nr:unnamed protein product [Vitrella brassicaformis CCMP3155]|eukprot:CEM04275.1 unnamed protein product [Vitrella brassicaformis CCMP3155]
MSCRVLQVLLHRRGIQHRCFASRARKRRKKNHMAYPIKPPTKVLRPDTDFPKAVLRRPDKVPMLSREDIPARPVRDLSEMSDEGDAQDGMRPIKPHEVAQMFRRDERTVGAVGDKIRHPSVLKQQLPREIKDIKEFSVDDIDPKKRPELQKFWYMPNPFRPQGTTAALSDTEYYRQFFADKDRALDGRQKEYEAMLADEKSQEDKEGRAGVARVRVKPSAYWIDEGYSTPEIGAVPFMQSMELRKAMMNEAYNVRKGCMLNVDVWEAFLRRAVELSDRVKARTLLRCLQAAASVRFPCTPEWKALVQSVCRRKTELLPQDFFYLFQACARQRWRDRHLLEALKAMALAWPKLKNKAAIKSANALAKLDMGREHLCQPLKISLHQRIDTLTPENCASMNALTIQECLRDVSVEPFLRQCMHHHQGVTFHQAKELTTLEYHLRLVRPGLYGRLDPSVKYFLEELRRDVIRAAGHTGQETFRDNPGEDSDREEEMAMGAGVDDEGEDDGEGDAPISDSDSDGDDATTPAQHDTGKQHGVSTMSSWVHRDVCRLLTHMGVPHTSGLKAGPYTVDIFHAPSNTLIELNAPFQYYVGTALLTAATRRRHEMLQAMGFRLQHISHTKWETLRTDAHKVAHLRRLLTLGDKSVSPSDDGASRETARGRREKARAETRASPLLQ